MELEIRQGVRESNLDKLIAQATKEASQSLLKNEHMQALAAMAPASSFEKKIKDRIESYVSTVRERAHSFAEMIARREADMDQRVARLNERDPQVIELVKAQIEAVNDEMGKRLRQTVREAGLILMQSIGISMETASKLVDEILSQEEKVIPFPTKKTGIS